MTITGQNLLRASFLNILATRLPDGQLQISEEIFTQWPESFEAAGVSFVLTEVEDEVMAIYFADGVAAMRDVLTHS